MTSDNFRIKVSGYFLCKTNNNNVAERGKFHSRHIYTTTDDERLMLVLLLLDLVAASCRIRVLRSLFIRLLFT